MSPGLQASAESKTTILKLGPHVRWRALFITSRFLTIKKMQDVVILRLKFNTRGVGMVTKWYIRVAEGKGLKSVGFSNSSKSKSWSTGIDLNIENMVTDGRPFIVHISQPKNDLDQYHATIDGVVVARASRFKAEPDSKFSSWQIEVAQGFDLTLVCCNHLWIRGRQIPFEHHVDLFVGRRHMQDPGLAPINQGLGQRRDQTIVGLPPCTGAAD